MDGQAGRQMDRWVGNLIKLKSKQSYNTGSTGLPRVTAGIKE